MTTASSAVDALRKGPGHLLEPAGLVRYEDVYNEDGVDLTLIREFMRLTPLERLSQVDSYAEEIEYLRTRIVRQP